MIQKETPSEGNPLTLGRTEERSTLASLFLEDGDG
jgi:hypothetical protein